MVYEMRVYTLLPGKVPEFEAMIEKEALPHLTRHATLVGWWSSEIGALNEVVHLWSYEDLAHRERARKAQGAEPALQAFRPKAQALVVNQRNQLLNPSSFSPLQ
jgi:hypothetical protein